MRAPLIASLVVAMAAASTASAKVTLLTDSRFVSAEFTSLCQPSHTENATPLPPFSDFEALLGVDFEIASQSSHTSEALMTASGSAVANVYCLSDAASHFVVEFAVDAPTPYRATGSFDALEGRAAISLTSEAATLFSESEMWAGGTFEYSGVLSPGTYVISATADALSLGASYDLELQLEGMPSAPAMGPAGVVALSLGVAASGVGAIRRGRRLGGWCAGIRRSARAGGRRA